VRPHVPVGIRIEPEAFVGKVCPEVAVGFLCGDQIGGDAIELRAQGRIARIGPGERGGVQPLADVLADPRMAARPVAIAGQQRLGIDRQQPVLGVDVDPLAEPAVDMNGRRRQNLGDVGQTSRHGIGQRLDAIGRGCRRKRQQQCKRE
jgi:hypothetical protein